MIIESYKSSLTFRIYIKKNLCLLNSKFHTKSFFKDSYSQWWKWK